MANHESNESNNKIATMNTKTSVVNMILAGTSLYCLKSQLDKDDGTPLFLVGWVYSTLTAALTILCEFMSDPNIQKLQHFMDKSSPSVILPFLASELMIRYDFDETLAMGNLALPLVFFYFYFTNNENSDVIKIQAGCLIVFIGGVCTMNENYYGLASAACYLLNLFHDKIPDKDTGNAVKTLSETLGHLMVCNAMEEAE